MAMSNNSTFHILFLTTLSCCLVFLSSKNHQALAFVVPVSRTLGISDTRRFQCATAAVPRLTSTTITSRSSSGSSHNCILPLRIRSSGRSPTNMSTTNTVTAVFSHPKPRQEISNHGISSRTIRPVSRQIPTRRGGTWRRPMTALYLSNRPDSFYPSAEEEPERRFRMRAREVEKLKSPQEMELEAMPLADDDDDDMNIKASRYSYDDDYDDDEIYEEGNDVSRGFNMDMGYVEYREYNRPRISKSQEMKRKKQRRQESYDDYDEGSVGSDYDNEVEEEDDDSYTGNYWTNPLGGIDMRGRDSDRYDRKRRNPSDRPNTRYVRKTLAPSSLRRRPPIKDRSVTREEQPYQAQSPSSRTSTRKTFRSGNPPPPNIMKEFYDRLFWYGFDPDETTTAADRTMFGGTKGKFDGLGLLQDIEEEAKSSWTGKPRKTSSRSIASESRRRTSESDNRNNWSSYEDEYEDGNDYNDDDDDASSSFAVPRSKRNISSREYTPSWVDEYEYEELDDWPEESMKNAGASRVYNDGYRRGISARQSDVSSWFEENDDYEDSDDITNERDQIKRYANKQNVSPSSSSSSSPIINILDSMFLINPDQIKNQAEDYDRRLGLGGGKNTRNNGAIRKRRKNFAYPYVPNDESEEFNRRDIRSIGSDDEVEIAKETNDVIDVEATVQPADSSKAAYKQKGKEGKRKQVSWEDRAAAYERVPPKGIMAWGPEGEIDGGIDARTYAAKTAMEEIAAAKKMFELKESNVSETEKELLQLKKEASIQKKLLLSLEDRHKSSMARDRLRRINFEIEDLARLLRRAKAEALAAIDKLESIELRHWALLRQYEADQELDGKNGQSQISLLPPDRN